MTGDVKRRVYNLGIEKEYIKDGLVFHIDAFDSIVNDSYISDLINGLSFQKNGNIYIRDGYLEFNGGTFLSNEVIQYPSDSCTIEACFESSDKSTFMIIMSNPPDDNDNGNVVLSIQHYDGYEIAFQSCYTKVKTGYFADNMKECKTLSVNNACGMSNGKEILASFQNVGFSEIKNAKSKIGGRSYSGTGVFKGKIYSIRIYNRQLTIDEMLHNQKVDNYRFKLGLII